MMKRALACLMLGMLSAVLFFPARAEETWIIDTSPASGVPETWEKPNVYRMLSRLYRDEFGPDVLVEVGEDYQPISVNGYPYRTVEAAFNVRSMKEKITVETSWVDYPFWRPATEYNGSLANMSLIMDMCSARDLKRGEDPDTFDPARNVERYLINAGFTDIRKDDYSKETSIYTISTAIGSRRMTHEGEEPFTLIAVGVCGAGYKNEWQSNLTAGTGELHEGFRSASDLVIDRLAGYIATRGIKGRVKIWISGYSRAAAVANLTAGRLTRSGVFPKEDVYAYTFATPAAVLNPPQTGDENIFNILCPMDVVPQIMPEQWGYGRYGKDLWLIVKEFSSVGESVTLERTKVIKDTFGLTIHYSAALNLRMRLLVSMMLDAIGNGSNYVRSVQDTAIGILQHMSTSSLLSTMRKLLTSMLNSDRNTRRTLDGLLNYIFRVFGNALTRTELGTVNQNSGSTLYLLLTEHREDTYLASMDSILNGIFEEAADFMYVMVKGPVDLTVTADEKPGWSMTLTERGTILNTDPNTGETTENPEFQQYYMERINGVSVAAIPQDLAIRAEWKAVSDGQVQVLTARCGVRASSLYPGASTDPVSVRAGNTGVAFSPEQRDGVTPEGFRDASLHAENLTRFLGIAAPFISWRYIAALFLLAVGLVMFLLIRLIILFFPNSEKRGPAVWILFAVFCVSVAEAEGAYFLLADLPMLRFLCKAVTGAAVLGVLFLRHPSGVKLKDSLLAGLAAAVAADLVMAWSFLPGTALFFITHMLFIWVFLKAGSMHRIQWIQWAVLSAAAAGLILIFFLPGFGASAAAAALYVPVLFLMVYSSSTQGPRVRSAALCFLLSDILLGAFLTVWPEPMAHILCTMLFTASLMMLAIGDQVPAGKQEEAL